MQYLKSGDVIRRRFFYFVDIVSKNYICSDYKTIRKSTIHTDNTMNNTYADLVKQTFNFPQEGFEVQDELSCNLTGWI